MKPTIALACGASLMALAAGGIAAAAVPPAIAPVSAMPTRGGTCTLKHLTVSGVNATYDPFEVMFTPVPVSMTVETSGSCSGARVQFALTPSPTSPNTGSQVIMAGGGQNQLLATVEDSGGQARPVTTAAAAFNGDQASVPVGSSGLLGGTPPLNLDVATGQPSAPGTYVAVLTLVARLTDGSGGVTSLSAPVVMTVNVQPSVRLAAGGSDLSIDLGELKAGAYGGPVGFNAYSNLDYEIDLQSVNNFTLARDGHGDGGVPYQPIISGQAVTATSTSDPGMKGARMIGFPAPAGSGRQHQTFSVQVLPFDHAPAADYSDQVTLRIRARV